MEYAIKLIRAYLSEVEEPAETRDSRDSLADSSPSANKPMLQLRPTMVVLSLTVIAALLIVTDIFLIGASVLTDGGSTLIPKLEKAFRLDKELNIPSYFSTLILLFSSVQLGMIGCIEHKYAPRREARFWFLLCGGFLFMSFDELVSVHEKLVEPLRGSLDGAGSGFFHFGWVVVAIPLVLVMGIMLFGFWLRLPSRVRKLTFAAAFLYLSGAVGMEMLNGRYAVSYGEENAVYRLMTTFEETFEIAGTIVFIYALFDFLALRFGSFELTIGHTAHTSFSNGSKG